MSGFSRGLRTRFAQYVSNQSPGASPTTWFAGLSTASPNDDGLSIAEPTFTNNYARQPITWTAVTTPAADGSVVLTNSNVLTFSSSGGGWSTGVTNLTHLFVNTGSTGLTEPTFIGYVPLTTPQAVASAGVTLTVAIGALQLTILQANSAD